MRHINLFYWGPKVGVFWVGAEKCMLKEFMCFFPSLVYRVYTHCQHHIHQYKQRIVIGVDECSS